MLKTYNIQIEETAIYGFEITIDDGDIDEANGDVDQAIRDMGEAIFIDCANLNKHLESIPNRAVCWFEEKQNTHGNDAKLKGTIK